jgi:redox-sensitive bicupin YhaK (pirin superfamily)
VTDVLWDVRRAGSRAVTSTDWLHSAHSFAFGSHYDPDNLSFGPLLVLNVDEVQPGEGYPRHRHAGVEIVTWVLAGVLEHVGLTGLTGSRLVGPGTLQYLSAGSGIEHVERSGSPTEPVRVVQMWLAAAEPGGSPQYRTAELLHQDGRLALAASGSRPAPISLRQPAAELFLGRLPAGSTVPLPVAAYLQVFVLSGAVTARGEAGQSDRLAVEDALRVTDAHAVGLTAEQDTELLVWAMTSSISG